VKPGPPSAKEIRGASPYAAIKDEPAPKLFVDPPLPDLLDHGVVWIQWRVENVNILPVFGKGALQVSPRIGHLDVHVDDVPWLTLTKRPTSTASSPPPNCASTGARSTDVPQRGGGPLPCRTWRIGHHTKQKMLPRLVAEHGGAALSRGHRVVSVDASGVEAAAEWHNLRSPETYVGYKRTERFVSPEVRDATAVVSTSPLHAWRSMNGSWTASGR